jgi:DNA (cytosine-5)-methyltransferase 1
MTHGSISTGIGGFDLGAKQNNIKTLWTCEIDPLRQDILRHYYPEAKHYGDMRNVRRKPRYVDCISFGFPCQDISNANPNAQGLEGKRSSIFYEGWRIIRAVRPKFIIIENSSILVTKGLGTILGLLAEAGYNAEWDIISCKAFGLPHIRKRIFIVAYAPQIGLDLFEGNRKRDFKCTKEKSTEECRLQFGRRAFQSMASETIPELQRMDNGIPKNIFQGLLAAAGDTVSPRITSWIFSRIKEAAKRR